MRRHGSLPLALLLTLPAAACVDNAGGDDSQDVSSALEQPNGGLSTSDEAPEFGAQADFTAAAIESDSVAADALASDPATTAVDSANVDRFAGVALGKNSIRRSGEHHTKPSQPCYA